MLEAIIRGSIRNRFLILVTTILLSAWGWQALNTTPLDAIPDLSDVQVIIRTNYPTYNLQGEGYYLAILMYMSSLKTVPTYTGQEQGFWNTLVRPHLIYRKGYYPGLVLMPLELAGSIATHCKTGFSNLSCKPCPAYLRSQPWAVWYVSTRSS